MKTFSLLAALLLALVVHSQTSDTVHVSLNDDLSLQNDTFKSGDTVAIVTQSHLPVPVMLNGKMMQPANDTTANLAFSVYSDLVGLGSNQPNGLVQTEGAWSWNLNVYRENPYYRKIRREEKLKLEQYRNTRDDQVNLLNAKYRAAAVRKKAATGKDPAHPLSSDELEKYEKDSTKDDLKLARRTVYYEYKKNQMKVQADRRDRISQPVPNNTWQFAIIKNVVFPVLTISKIDNKDRFRQVIYYDSITPPADSLQAADTTTQRYIHTFDLVRYSNVSISTKVNLLYFYFNRPKINIYVDFYAGLFSTGVRDTTLSKTNFYVYSRALGYNIRAATHLNQKINIEVWLTSFYITLLNNDIYQKSGPLHFPDSNPANDVVSPSDRDGKISRGQRNIWTLGSQLVYTPNPENKSNKVFLRVMYFKNPEISSDSGVKKVNGNNFMQFQVGYRKSIDIRNL